MPPIIFQMTEGFSPHAKMSFASELPVGVVALNEPVDVWLEGSLSDLQFKIWSESLATGFKLNSFIEVPDGSPSLSKSCPLSEYLLRTRLVDKMEQAKKTISDMKSDMKENMIINCSDEEEFMKLTINNNAVTLGTIVKKLISENVIEGWHELCIVRARLKSWTEK